MRTCKYRNRLYSLQTTAGVFEKVLEGGYGAFESSSGWKNRPQYLKCLVIDLPITYSEQLSHMNDQIKNK